MKKYEKPEIHITRFSTENVMTLSGEYQTIEQQAEAILNENSVSAIFELQI